MENEKCLKNDFTKNCVINDIDFDANKNDLNSLSLLPKIEDKYLKNKGLCQNDNDFLESDEYDYDSDCSLGSMNSLDLHLNDDRTFQSSKRNEKQSQYRNINVSITNDHTTNNLVTKTHILEEKPFDLNIKDAKPVEKLSTVVFYGKQKSITQYIHNTRSYKRQHKTKYTYSKTNKAAYSICKFKHKAQKLRISLKNQHHRKRLFIQKILDGKNIFQKNKNLLRYKLKENIPLLQSRNKMKEKVSQMSEKYSNTHEKFSENKKDITDRKTTNNANCFLEYGYIANQIYDSNSFFIEDFDDTDDFSGTKVIEDIIKKLFDEDDLLEYFSSENYK